MGQLEQFITNHWQLWLALVILLLLIYINELFTRKKQAAGLSPQAAVNMINNEEAVVIDLRDPESFRSGHIIDAVRASAEDFALKRMEKYKEKALILVCPRGLQSAPLANKLKQQGFKQAMVLSGGITAWQSAELPLVKGK